MLNLRVAHQSLLDLLAEEETWRQTAPARGAVRAGAWSRREQLLIWSDTAEDAVFAREENGAARAMLDLCCDACAWDCNGNLVMVRDRSRLVRAKRGGGEEMVSGGVGSTPFHRLSALAIHSNGMIYTADNREGRGEPCAASVTNPIACRSLPAGDDLSAPAGVCFSADERFLYLSEPARRWVLKFNLLPDGALCYKRIHCVLDPALDPGELNLAVDAAENLWVAADQAIHLFHAGGMFLGAVSTPARCFDLCFGGENLRTLYAFCEGGVYEITTKQPGAGLCR